MKLYVAGPISGRPDANFPAFAAADSALRELGYQVSNPHVVCAHLPHGSAWEAYMRLCIRALTHCDAVALLDGYKDSRGAKSEIATALMLGMPVHPLAYWVAQRVAA